VTDKKPALTGVDKEHYNPMITADGNTYRVSSALTALACFLENDRTVEADSAADYGLSVLLSTCAAALRNMGDAS